MREVKAPINPSTETRVFLAGSIEMGAALNWQDEVVEALRPVSNIVLLNPRRDDWDSSWEQSIDNPMFLAQVQWELEQMEQADLILMHFQPGTFSPITLLELGLNARSGKLVVHCPKGYWRKGNVDVVCRKYGISTTNSLTGLARAAATFAAVRCGV